MEVSIVIINFNTFKLTCTCIQSVIDKTEGLNYEIILVDNASKECSPDLFKEKFPEVILLKSEENLGFAKGNNFGISHASYENILLLNSDVELINNAIYLACKRLEQDKSIGALSGKLLYPDGRMQHVGGRFPSLSRELKELLRINKSLSKSQRSEVFLGTEFDHLSEKEVDWVWGAFFLTRRSVINQFPNKKLQEDFFMYIEDMQWCFTLKKLGYKIIYYPDASAFHYISSSATDIKNEYDKYRKKIFPNLFQLLKKEKGIVYTYMYFTVKIIHLLSLRRKNDLENAKFHFNYLIGNANNS